VLIAGDDARIHIGAALSLATTRDPAAP
jgi:hypothetical protein